MNLLFILHKHPKKYPQQNNFTYCGLFNAKAIIEANNPSLSEPASHYALSRIHKLIGFSFWSHLVEIFKRYNINAVYGICKHKTIEGQVHFLKQELKKGPVLITIAHSYDKRTRFSLLRTILWHHHMTIWGYNDAEQVFYCYDSHTDIVSPETPVGNIAIHYEYLVSYRQLCGLGLFGKRYISTEMSQ